MVAMSDELLHLRGFLRFTTRSPSLGPRTRQPAYTPSQAIYAFDPSTLNKSSIRGAGTSGVAAGLSVAAGAELSSGADSTEEGLLKDTAAVAVVGGGAERWVRPLPRLLISGQWRHKREVLALLAQLRQVEVRAAEVEEQMQQAER